ncbi:MAG: NnrS family protein [Mobilicoccus sp.]|nr:NnrS family protein [Mobilicoccus sp.]
MAYPATWPGSGPWVASSRVLFVLVCLWAAIVVPLWWWGVLSPRPPGWHAHEMMFAIGGGALAAYVPTACNSWTGRPPVAGWPVAVLAVLYVSARTVMLLPTESLPRLLVGVALVAPFWWITGVVLREMRRAGKSVAAAVFPYSVLAFCALAGAAAGWFGSGIMTGSPHRAAPQALVGMFALLLAGVGGRMVPAFLNAAATRVGLPVRTGHRFARLPFLLALALAVISAGTSASAVFTVLGGVLLAVHMAGWPWRYLRYDGLAALTALAYAWLPLGLIVWGGLRWSGTHLSLGMVAASHLITMGALTGLVVAVMARTSARRGDRRLIVRRTTLAGFVLLMSAVPIRLLEWDTAAVVMWSLGWCLVLLGHRHHLTGPLIRPVFSARRGVPSA